MKTILDLIPTFDKTNATSKDLYFVAGHLVTTYGTINKIKAVKTEISETFGNYKEILSRCKELIKNGVNNDKKAVLSQFTYKAVLSSAWDIAKKDPKFSAICAEAEKDGLFVTADDFIRRYYPYINENGTPLIRQSYTDGWYKWTEYHERPIEKFTDSFALSAVKASVRYFYDKMRNNALSRKTRINEMPCDVPLKVAYLDESKDLDTLNLETALAEIETAKAESRVLTTREYNEALKK